MLIGVSWCSCRYVIIVTFNNKMLRHLQTFVYKFRNILLKIKFKIVFFAYKSKDFFVIFLLFGNISFILICNLSIFPFSLEGRCFLTFPIFRSVFIKLNNVIGKIACILKSLLSENRHFCQNFSFLIPGSYTPGEFCQL